MKYLILVVAFSLQILGAVTPQAPKIMELSSHELIELSLAEKMDTVLYFPQGVSFISGVGLFSGEEFGIVQYEHSDLDPRLLLLMPQSAEFEVIMKVMIQGRLYAFKLIPSEQPCSVVTFLSEGQRINQVQSLEQVQSAVSQPVAKRQDELMRLAKEEAFLRARIPVEYEDYRSKLVGIACVYGEWEVLGNRVGRFDESDAIVVIGKIRYRGNRTASFPVQQLRLKVGSQYYRFNRFEINLLGFRPNQEMEFAAILLGDGAGKPAHLSLQNQFDLRFQLN